MVRTGPGARQSRGRRGDSDEARFAVHLTPRGGADRVDGVVDGVLKCRVAAAPADGAANAALLRLLAGELRLPPSALRLVGGATGRRKIIAIDADDRERLTARWPGLLD